MNVPRFLQRISGSPLLIIVGYFITVAAALAAVMWLFPSLRELVTRVVETSRAADQFQGAIQETVGVQGSRPLVEHALVGVLVLSASLMFVAPVAWIYMVTKRQEGYEKTFVQVLIMLPLAVAAVVRVVRGDLALAFALAGIVAAVRFRTTLRDLKNAVFAFVAIGIGLASGTGAWVLAGILAGVFSIAAYGLWRLNVGGLDPTLAVPAGPMRLSEALVPGETHESVAVGNKELLAPLTNAKLRRVARHAQQLAHYIRADALRPKQKYDTLLLIYAAEPSIAREIAEELLGEYAKRWHLVDNLPGPDGTEILEYLVRLKKRANVGEFLDRLHCDDDCPMRAAEMKPIRGLRTLVT